MNNDIITLKHLFYLKFLNILVNYSKKMCRNFNWANLRFLQKKCNSKTLKSSLFAKFQKNRQSGFCKVLSQNKIIYTL